MVNKTYYSASGVPTSVDAENNHSERTRNKYTVNRGSGGVCCVLTRWALLLLLAGMALLLAVAILTTYLLVQAACPASGTGLAATGLTTQAATDLGANLRVMEDDRLPSHLKPTHYRIELMPFIWEGNFTTLGEVWMTVHVAQPTNRVSVHAHELAVDEASVEVWDSDDPAAQVLAVSRHEPEPGRQRYTAVLDDMLRAGRNYTLHLRFTGRLNDLLQGFYRISYIDQPSRKIRYMAATQFSPTDARRAFPCMDDPALKARFNVSLARHKDFVAVSNMPLRNTQPIAEMEGWVWDHFETTPVMSTYLVAMVVSQLKPFHYSVPGGAFNLSVWTRQEALYQTRFAGTIAPAILRYFQTYFQLPYPLPKVDIIALPDFGFQAMENWGLITFRESSLLFDENASTIESNRHIATVVSHELGHQWFGNLVTPDWWDDLWLKEGFATYTEYLGVNHVQPTWSFMDEFVLDAIQSSMALDCLRFSHPIHVPVHAVEEIRQIFDPISYKKGASVIRMLNHVLGENTFKLGLINFLNAHKFANAHHDDLWDALTKQAHLDGTLDQNMTLKQIMDSWILQTGYPLLTVTRNYDDNSVFINQERFLLSKNLSENSLWWVPISYTTFEENNYENSAPKLWMNEHEVTIKNVTSNNWLYVNVKHGGYYRVNYDIENWGRLAKHLQQFPRDIQAQLIDDSMQLARANMLDYEIPFSLVIEAFRRTQYVPMASALNNLRYIDNMLATTSAYGKFKLFMSQLTRSTYESLGFFEKPTDDYEKKMRRVEVLKWACTFENSDCTIHARQLFRDWMIDELDTVEKPNKRTVPPNLRSIVYCTAIREGDEAEWNFAFGKYLFTNSGTEKEVLLTALGCASQPWLLPRYLDYALSNSSGIRKQDGNIVFSSVAQNVAGHLLSFEFIRTHWKDLNAHYGKAFSTISKMVSSLPVFMNTPFELSELEAFKDANINELGTAKRAFDQSIEMTRYNVEWMTNSYDSVVGWLDDTIRRYRLHSYNFN